jgi:alkylated DNA repair dioxygenase AlkB
VNPAPAGPGPRSNLLPKDGEAWLDPDFLVPREADRFEAALATGLDWAQETAFLFGRRVAVPRLTAWYGDHPYTYSGVTHPPAPWPPVLAELRDRVRAVAPGMNAVLANRYRDGRDSVSWHSDDEPEFGPDPVIASVSLGATRRFSLRHRATRVRVDVDLPHGSLLLMAGASQRAWHHALPKTARPVGPRINLTFRRIIETAPH